MKNINKQEGAALVIGLLMLLVMTLLGVSSMSTTTTSLKMSVNTQIQNSAFQVAATVLNQSLVEHTDPVKRTSWSEYSGLELPVLSIEELDTSATSGLANTQMSATKQYIGCDANVIGDSRARALIYKVVGTGAITNSVGTAISTNIQAMGVQAFSAGCPEDSL
ncbi:MAG: PilX N-terminal domain-containing pilus assembly protein [Gammaproteobacteria bacterium]|nr:PilX N-terminal domain-containing pilus assembly protein [Gammaproteobacteria bacterium]MCW8910736.1 PilX N-terminal domain-containing pilus assembly protein [Gammaproteobacteria bacterium]